MTPSSTSSSTTRSIIPGFISLSLIFVFYTDARQGSADSAGAIVDCNRERNLCAEQLSGKYRRGGGSGQSPLLARARLTQPCDRATRFLERAAFLDQVPPCNSERA